MDDFDLDTLKINPNDPILMPTRRGGDHKARRYFVKVPWAWVLKLDGASGQVYRLALHILFQHFRERGGSITLTNTRAGMPRQSKFRCLRDLEERGLVTVTWRERRAPLIQVKLSPGRDSWCHQDGTVLAQTVPGSGHRSYFFSMSCSFLK
jgi:hypothetical protein